MCAMLNCDSVGSGPAHLMDSLCNLCDALCLCGKRSLSNFTTKTQRTTERHRKISRSRHAFVLLLTAYCLLLTAACRRDMQDQPKAIAYRENSFYKDGTGSRPLVEGTVPRGYLREDREFYLGKKPATSKQPGPTLTQPAGAQATAPSISLPT